jgi:hypothetical protein
MDGQVEERTQQVSNQHQRAGKKEKYLRKIVKVWGDIVLQPSSTSLLGVLFGCVIRPAEGYGYKLEVTEQRLKRLKTSKFALRSNK